VLPLVVKLHNTKSNTTDVFAFESSPVRIGRNKLNELHVHEDVVSQWHGLFRFGDGFVVFIDLGSTNGTMLNGQRIARNTEVPLAADSVLRIAHLEMRFARVAVPPAAITRKQSSFLAQPGDQSIAGARTVMFQAGALQAPRAESADQRILAEIVQGTEPVYKQYMQSLEQVTRYVEHYLEHVPADQKGAMVMALREKLPHFARTREFRRLALKAGILPEQLGDVDVEAWVKRLVFGSDEAPAARGLIDTHQALERVGAILEAFAQALVDLRSGHEQFLQDAGIRLNSDLNGLEGPALRARRARVPPRLVRHGPGPPRRPQPRVRRRRDAPGRAHQRHGRGRPRHPHVHEPGDDGRCTTDHARSRGPRRLRRRLLRRQGQDVVEELRGQARRARRRRPLRA
jgi:hypothetical protein